MVQRLVIKNSRGETMTIVQGEDKEAGIMGNQASGLVEAMVTGGTCPDGYLDAKTLAKVLMYFEEHSTTESEQQYEQDMENIYNDG